MANKIYTLSYFRKRLLDNKIKSTIIVGKYPTNDVRYWTVLIGPNSYKMICTCRKNSSSEYNFNIQIPNGNSVTLRTKSMEVISDFINDNKIFGESNE